MSRIIKRFQPEEQGSEDSIVADWGAYSGVTGSQAGLAGNRFSQASRGFVSPTLDQQQLLYYYIYSQPIANAIDVVPTNSLKSAPIISALEDGGKDDDLIEMVQDVLTNMLPIIRHCAHLARLYGWAIMPMFTEELDLSTPPDYSRGGIISDVRAVAGGMSFDASVTRYWDDPRSRYYGEPMVFRIPPGEEIHADRCVLMKGLADNRPLKNKGQYGLGYSLIEPMAPAWENYLSAICANLKILEDKSIDVIKIPNFRQILRKPKELAAVMAALRKCRKEMGGYILDSEGDYQVTDRSLTGINDAMSQVLTFISMQANLSDTLLFGISPAGLTSGSYETGVLNKLTSIYQQSELTPVFQKIIDTLFELNGRSDLKYKLTFPSSFETTELEQSEIDSSKSKGFSDLSSGLATLVAAGLMTDEVAASIAHHAVDGINGNVIMSQIGEGDASLLPEEEEPLELEPLAPGLSPITDPEPIRPAKA
jgi:hypothetical protein